ncbi:MAG: DinB family protein [Chloroflexi bacterium]|nr:MAG: DinB family protein [Chloroflexota bacterium]
MLPNTSPVLDAIFQGWNVYQEQLIVVLQPLSSEQLAIRVAPNLRSVGEIAAHISAGRASWFSWILNEGGDEIATIAHWDDQDQLVRAAAELVHGLDVTWAMIQNALSHWTPTELAAPIVVPWVGPEHPISRAWILWHLLEHDLHHGGELTQTLGMSGLVVKLPPPRPET